VIGLSKLHVSVGAPLQSLLLYKLPTALKNTGAHEKSVFTASGVALSEVRKKSNQEKEKEREIHLKKDENTVT